MVFFVCGVLGHSVVQIRQDIEKRFSASLKVVKKAFPVKNWNLKYSFVSFPKFALFAKFSKKYHVLSFLLMPCLCDIKGTQ